jgi:hypothetical protein
MGQMLLESARKEEYLNNLLFSLARAHDIDFPNQVQIKQIRNLAKLLRKDEISGIYDSIHIDTESSGMATIRYISEMNAHKNNAHKFLAILPSVDGIVEQAVDRLYSGSSDFSGLQDKLRKVFFYKAVKDSELPNLAHFHVSYEETEGWFKRVSLEYDCFDEVKVRFVNYLVDFVCKRGGKYVSLGTPTKALKHLVENEHVVGTKFMFDEIDKAKGIMPIRVQRTMVGPFCTAYTKNAPQLTPVFKAFPEGYSLEIREEHMEDTDLYLSGDYDFAFSETYPEYRKIHSMRRRNFFCSDREFIEALELRLGDEEALLRFYEVKKDE